MGGPAEGFSLFAQLFGGRAGSAVTCGQVGAGEVWLPGFAWKAGQRQGKAKPGGIWIYL